MKFLRYEADGKTFYGVLKGDRVHPVTGNIFETYTVAEEGVSLNSVRVLVPCEPTKIVAVGLNYSEHARDMK